MSNELQAVATIKFYANKHVEVELSSIKGITPRTLEIAGNLLHKTYRGNKAKFVAAEHKKARERKVKAEEDAVVNEAKFHEKEDERLAEAAKEDVKEALESLTTINESKEKTIEESEEESEEEDDEESIEESAEETTEKGT